MTQDGSADDALNLFGTQAQRNTNIHFMNSGYTSVIKGIINSFVREGCCRQDNQASPDVKNSPCYQAPRDICRVPANYDGDHTFDHPDNGATLECNSLMSNMNRCPNGPMCDTSQSPSQIQDFTSGTFDCTSASNDVKMHVQRIGSQCCGGNSATGTDAESVCGPVPTAAGGTNGVDPNAAGGGTLAADGATCTADSQCASNNCNAAGSCATAAGGGYGTLAADGETCNTNSDCTSDMCNGDFVCATAAAGGGAGPLAADGDTCTADSQCASNNCNAAGSCATAA